MILALSLSLWIQARRRQEDNLAVVFMGLVGVFFLCHILRVALNIHEMLVIEHAMKCFDAGMQGFPLWSLILGKIRCDHDHA